MVSVCFSLFLSTETGRKVYSCHKCPFSTGDEISWLSHENNCESPPLTNKTKDNLLESSHFDIDSDAAAAAPAASATASEDSSGEEGDPTSSSSSFGAVLSGGKAAFSASSAAAAASSSNGGQIAPAAFSRTYTCKVCKYSTTKSRLFLYHQINEHSARFHVYPCDRCEYATR